MERKFEKFAYYAHDFKGNAVMAESFETLSKFYDYAKSNQMDVCYCPCNHASTMVKGFKIINPN